MGFAFIDPFPICGSFLLSRIFGPFCGGWYLTISNKNKLHREMKFNVVAPFSICM